MLLQYVGYHERCDVNVTTICRISWKVWCTCYYKGAHKETRVPFKHMLNWRFSSGCSKKSGSLFDITQIVFEQSHLYTITGISIRRGSVMELDFSQIAPKVNHPGFLQVSALSMHNFCLHTQSHAYWYKNVMHLSRLFRRLILKAQFQISKPGMF